MSKELQKLYIRYPAQYTEVLINIMENDQTRPFLDNALANYPLYESKLDHKQIPNFIPTRAEINKALLDHYKYREIGFETVGRFLDELRISMNEIMPYYNQILYTMDLDYDVLHNVDYTRKTDRKKESEVTNTGTTSSTETDTSETQGDTTVNSKNVRSETPQDLLNITTKNINNVNYANEVSWNEDISHSEGSSEGTSEITGTSETNGVSEDNENVLEHTKGNFGVVSSQDLIRKYRDLATNVIQDIIRNQRIKELFMTIY